jgi:hypothetical protein
MTVKLTSPSRVTVDFTLMPVLSIWLVCLKLELKKYYASLSCIAFSSEDDVAYATHFLLKYHYGREPKVIRC